MKKIIAVTVLFLSIIGVGLCLPEDPVIPVVGASSADWNKDSFWYDPWGSSGVHKGIDIFAGKGEQLNSATYGLVLFSGDIKKGGLVTAILGPKWRVHYYAHLDSLDVSAFEWVSRNEKIGRVGDTGNAKGKQPHVHYSILSLFPRPWDFSTENQGWKKMFYVDPANWLSK